MLRHVFTTCAALGLIAAGCSSGGSADAGTTITTSPTTLGDGDGDADSSSDSDDNGDGDGDGDDTGDGDGDGDSGGCPPGGCLDLMQDTTCAAVDMLFVVDNSSSMGTYQTALKNAFPSFVDSMYAALPSNTSLHVGITTTTFAQFCNTPEAEQNCQTTADAAAVTDHYDKPTNEPNELNGAQGRLFTYNQKQFFETSTAEPNDELKTWFSGAMTAAGELGCTFEMPVAAAGWVFDPLNTATGVEPPNADFVRDEDAVLVIFFLTDEPDKTPDSKSIHIDKVLEAKAGCGGEDCIVVTGLIDSCVATPQVNNKLWQFMTAFGNENPPFGEIEDTNDYEALVGASLASVISEACYNLPPVG